MEIGQTIRAPGGGATRTFRAIEGKDSQQGVRERWHQRAIREQTRSISGEGRGGEAEPQCSAVTWRAEGETYFGRHCGSLTEVGMSRWMAEKRERGQIDEGWCLQRQDLGCLVGRIGGDERFDGATRLS